MFTKPCEAWEFDYAPVPEPKIPRQREQKLFFRAIHITQHNENVKPTIKVIFNDTYAYLGTYADFSQYEQGFYDTLEAQHMFWEKTFVSERKFTTPNLPSGDDIDGVYIWNQVCHSIIKDMITRKDYFFASYGVYPGYGIPGNNGFQEILTVSLQVALEWGMFDYAKGVLMNYLDYYWLGSGNVMYHGLEMAELARMLTHLAMYYRYTGDYFFVNDTYLQSINGTVNLLLDRYNKSCNSSGLLNGIATGNDDADLWVTTVRGGYTEYPFYSISSEMSRAFDELGRALYDIGSHDLDTSVIHLGKRMLAVAPTMLSDLLNSLHVARQLILISGRYSDFCLPYIAGQKVCDNIPGSASVRVSEPWRTYSEMMYSGVLSPQNVQDILNYSCMFNASMKMGMLSGTGVDCCGSQLMTVTSHGFAWGLLQHDKVAEFLLMFFTASSHSMSRGHWTAPESSSIDCTQTSVAYCSSSQGLVPLMLKWMLVFEDFFTGSVWIGKAVPREWMKEGLNQLSVANASVIWFSDCDLQIRVHLQGVYQYLHHPTPQSFLG